MPEKTGNRLGEVKHKPETLLQHAPRRFYHAALPHKTLLFGRHQPLHVPARRGQDMPMLFAQPLKHLTPQKVAGVADEQAAQSLGQRLRMLAVVIAAGA